MRFLGRWGRRCTFLFLLLWSFSSQECFAREDYPCALSLQQLIAFEKMKEHFLQMQRQHPELGLDSRIRIVALVVAVRDGQVLLGRRLNGIEEGSWGVVGGKMDQEDLDLLSAAIREFKEETGLDLDRERLRFVRSLPPQVAVEDGFYYAPYLFRVELRSDEEARVMEPDKLSEGWRWFRPEEMPHPLFSTNARFFSNPDFLRALLSGDI